MTTSITLDLEKTDLCGGETVRGVVRLSTERDLPARGLRILFHGRENVEWKEGGGKNSHHRTASLTFFKEEVTFLGVPPQNLFQDIGDAVRSLFSKDGFITIPAGTHEHSFSYTLPEGLPGDYQSDGPSGIIYEITAYVDLPMKIDLSATCRLTVYEPFIPAETGPVKGEGEKTFAFSDGEALSLSVAVERGWYFPGDTVRGEINMSNLTGKDVTSLTVGLRKVEVLRAQDRLRPSSLLFPLASFPKPFGEAREARISFEGLLPADLYASVKGALVQVDYELVASLDVPWALDLEVRVPVRLVERAGLASGPKT